jgi:hypothetical protein
MMQLLPMVSYRIRYGVPLLVGYSPFFLCTLRRFDLLFFVFISYIVVLFGENAIFYLLPIFYLFAFVRCLKLCAFFELYF